MAGLIDFTVDDLEHFSEVLRDVGAGATDMAAAAQRVADFLLHNLCQAGGSPACLAVSVHKTHPYGLLPPHLRQLVTAEVEDPDATSCLVRLAMAGTPITGPAASGAIMALDQDIIDSDPLLPAMAVTMGVPCSMFLDPTSVVLSGVHREDLPAFLVPEIATTSLVPPDARTRLQAAGARSLLVLCGGLPTGDLFFTWLVGRDRPTDKSVRFLRALTSAIKATLIPFALHPWKTDPPTM